MVDYVTRAEIGLLAPNGSHSLVPSQVKNVAFHYPGTPNPINAVGSAGLARVKSALRGWQAYHMDSRGWSDIAYCVAVDQVGRAYTLRGINIRSAANGGTQVNLEYGAILLVLGNSEAPSAAMEATSRAVVQDYRVRFSRIPNRPTWHGAIRPGGTASDPSTDCPGTRTIAAIKAGKFDAGSTPVTPPTQDWFDMATKADLKAVVDESISDYMSGLYNLAANGTAAKNHAEIESLIRALLDQEADRYQVYYNKMQAILAAVAADDANDVTQADVDGILAKVEELKPAGNL